MQTKLNLYLGSGTCSWTWLPGNKSFEAGSSQHDCLTTITVRVHVQDKRLTKKMETFKGDGWKNFPLTVQPVKPWNKLLGNICGFLNRGVQEEGDGTPLSLLSSIYWVDRVRSSFQCWGTPSSCENVWRRVAFRAALAAVELMTHEDPAGWIWGSTGKLTNSEMPPAQKTMSQAGYKHRNINYYCDHYGNSNN